MKTMKHKPKMTIRKISDRSAKKEIGGFFIRQSSRGVKRVDVAHVSSALGLPGTQVEKIFYQFIKAGRVARA